MARNSVIIILDGAVPQSRTFLTLFGNVSDDKYQITCKALDDNGNEIIPVSAELIVKIQPRGGTIFLEADENLNVAEGEMYRKFEINGTGIQLQGTNLSPEVDKLEVTITVMS